MASATGIGVADGCEATGSPSSAVWPLVQKTSAPLASNRGVGFKPLSRAELVLQHSQ